MPDRDGAVPIGLSPCSDGGGAAKLSGPMVNAGCRPPWTECAEAGLEDAGELEEEAPARAGFAPTTLTLGGEVCGVMVTGSPPGCRTGCRVER